METTVIIIKGDNQSILQDIAKALSPVKETTPAPAPKAPVAEKQVRPPKCPYNWTATITDKQTKVLNRFLRNKNVKFTFDEIKAYVNANSDKGIPNKILSDELQKRNFIRIAIGNEKSINYWIRSV